MTNHKPAGAPASNQYGQFAVHYASPAQQRYIAKLLGERNHLLTDIDPTTVNIKHASDIIDMLLACPLKSEFVVRASDKQVSFIESLVQSKVDGQTRLDRYLSDMSITSVGELTSVTARKVIDGLLQLPSVPRDVQVDVGAYRYDGVLYSVRRSRESGKLHAYHWSSATNNWEYSGNIKYDLRPEHRLTIGEAMEFGIQTGTCVHCGRTLTDKDSVRYGMGTTCRKKYQ
jgi:hypothetical protein